MQHTELQNNVANQHDMQHIYAPNNIWDIMFKYNLQPWFTLQALEVLARMTIHFGHLTTHKTASYPDVILFHVNSESTPGKCLLSKTDSGIPCEEIEDVPANN